jgi:hypothetical protein
MARAKHIGTQAFKLTRSDRRIFEQYGDTGDVRYLTSWYWNWEPFEGQHRWMNALLFGNHTEAYLTTGSRYGKTDATAVCLLLLAKLKRIPVVNTSITQDQAELAWTRAEDLVLQNPRCHHWIAWPIHHSPFPLIEFIPGGEFGARSTQYKCKHLRGYAFGHVNYDEVAYGHPDDMEVLKMRVADFNGCVSGTTTPRAKNWYYRDCWKPSEREVAHAKVEGRVPLQYVQRGTSLENPHISREYLEKRVRMTDTQWRQEVMGEFVDVEGRPFLVESIEGCTDADLNPLYDQVCKRVQMGKRLPDILKDARFMVSWDLAKRADWTVGGALRIDRKPWDLVWYIRYQHKPWPGVERDIDRSALIFDADVIVDTTGVGDVTFDHLAVPTDQLHRCDLYGKKLKQEILTCLQWCLDNKMLRLPFIRQLQDELFDYEWDDHNLVTDSVMMLAMLCWLACGETPPVEVI